MDLVLIFFHIMVGSEGKQNTAFGVRIFAHSISSHDRLNETESAVFLNCRFFLFLKDPFSQII